MHVTFVTPAFLHPERGDFPGIRRYSTELVTALARYGLAVRVVTPEPVDEEGESLRNVEVVQLAPSRAFFGRTRNVAQAAMLSFGKRFVRERRLVRDTDIVHSDLPLLGIDSIRRSCPVVATGHHLERVRRPQDLLSVPFGNSYGSHTYRNADVVVTPSEATALKLSRHFGISRNRIQVIHHGIDASKFYPEKPSRGFPRNPSTRRILFVGPMNERKNVVLLLQAFERIIKTRPNTELVLVGSGPLDKRIDQIVREKPSGGIVTRLKQLDDAQLRQLYWSADVFASPSLDEGFGFAVVEAMACRTPVAILETRVSREIAGDAAFLVGGTNQAMWTASLSKLLGDPQLCDEYAERGSNHVAREYSWQTAAENYARMYRELVDGRVSNHN